MYRPISSKASHRSEQMTDTKRGNSLGCRVRKTREFIVTPQMSLLGVLLSLFDDNDNARAADLPARRDSVVDFCVLSGYVGMLESDKTFAVA